MPKLIIPAILFILIGIAMLAAGAMFKLMHWPGVFYLFLIGSIEALAGCSILLWCLLKAVSRK